MNLFKHFKTLSQAILILLAVSFSTQAAGEVDPTFNPILVDVDYISTSGSLERTSVYRVAVQPDGKILAVGLFSVVNNSLYDNIVRFNADGTLDTTFNPPALTKTGSLTYLEIGALALQPDGKILIGGNFITSGAVIRQNIARLNADGSLDPSFNINAGQGSGGTVRDIEISADGKIIIGGDYNAGSKQDVIRVFSDGTVDNTFTAQIPQSPSNSGAYDVAVQPDGEILASLDYPSGEAIMYRFNVDGSVDFSHITNGQLDVVYRIVIQPDGKILLGGSFDSIDGFTVPRSIVRLNADGSVDTSFNISNSGAIGDVRDIELLANGKILIGGSFGTYNGTLRQYIALLNNDGSLDTTYNYTARTLRVNDFALQADGKLIVGTQVEFESSLQPPIVRLNADATFDSSLQPFMGNAGKVNKVLVQPDGKILISGFYNNVYSVFRRNLGRFETDGTYDSSFSATGLDFGFISQVGELDLQPDGKILVGGNINNGVRLNPNGAFDVTLSNSPNPPSIRYLPSGKLLLISGDIKRYSSQGFFESQTVRLDGGGAYKAAIQPDGKIIIVGTFTEINLSTFRNRIARLNDDGTFDAAFDPPGGANGRISDVLLQADGKIIIGGQFTSVNNNSNYKYLARLNADGTLDTSFNPILNGEVTCLKIQPDGKILFGGAMTIVNGVPRRSVARVNTNGTLDASLNLGSGTDGLVNSVDLQSDGKIIIGGDFKRVNGVPRFGVARLLNSTAPQQKLFDYDGDGKADVSVFRPSENRWYVFRSSDSTVAQQAFAISNDVPVPADYDGDGKTDYAIYRPSNGDWWYLSSINNAQINVNWGGETGDIPRPTDFDGDGKTDFVIFRPTNNIWYRINGVTGAFSSVPFGLAGDKTVRGDFDGDGKSDPAIYRPSTGDWWYQSSINGAQLATRWGISTDIPTPADFDGDGKTDFAVYRPSTGVWYIYNSSTGSATIMAFGLAEDKPTAADYDGDGKADIAVFRPSTGIWYLMRSTAGFGATQFGVSTDIPTENAFIP